MDTCERSNSELVGLLREHAQSTSDAVKSVQNDLSKAVDEITKLVSDRLGDASPSSQVLIRAAHDDLSTRIQMLRGNVIAAVDARLQRTREES